MATNGNPKNIHQLDDALSRFDERLGELQIDETVEIRAIGGFALLRHGVRKGENAVTVDIDTVTRDYQARVVEVIQEVAREKNLDVDWINNYNLMDEDPHHVESMIGAEWLPRDEGLINVDLRVATIETITRAKIIAAADSELSGRTQDRPDLIELIEHQGIKSLREFDRKYPDDNRENTESRRIVGVHLGEIQDHSPSREAFYDRYPELRPESADDAYGLGGLDDLTDRDDFEY